jgi:hypothetical protein
MSNDTSATAVTIADYCWHHNLLDADPETRWMAINIASMAAYDEARKTDRNHVVVLTPAPAPAVYVLARDHPALSNFALNVILELTPTGDEIKLSRH